MKKDFLRIFVLRDNALVCRLISSLLRQGIRNFFSSNSFSNWNEELIDIIAESYSKLHRMINK